MEPRHCSSSKSPRSFSVSMRRKDCDPWRIITDFCMRISVSRMSDDTAKGNLLGENAVIEGTTSILQHFSLQAARFL